MPYVVEVGGDIDIGTVNDLEEPVITAIEHGQRPVILDLSECSFIDSSGVRLLLRAYRLLHPNGGQFRLMAVVARDHVARMLRLTALDSVFPVVASRAEAESVLDFPQSA
jgi:anti-sigma B factor antagonist